MEASPEILTAHRVKRVPLGGSRTYMHVLIYMCKYVCGKAPEKLGVHPGWWERGTVCLGKPLEVPVNAGLFGWT